MANENLKLGLLCNLYPNTVQFILEYRTELKDILTQKKKHTY